LLPPPIAIWVPDLVVAIGRTGGQKSRGGRECKRVGGRLMVHYLLTTRRVLPFFAAAVAAVAAAAAADD